MATQKAVEATQVKAGDRSTKPGDAHSTQAAHTMLAQVDGLPTPPVDNTMPAGFPQIAVDKVSFGEGVGAAFVPCLFAGYTLVTPVAQQIGWKLGMGGDDNVSMALGVGEGSAILCSVIGGMIGKARDK